MSTHQRTRTGPGGRNPRRPQAVSPAWRAYSVSPGLAGVLGVPRPSGHSVSPAQRAYSVSPGLAGVLGGARLPDHGDADLPRVGQFLFYLLGDIMRDHLRMDVIHLVRLDHDPDFPAGLH